MKPWKLCIVSLLAAGTLAGAYFTYVAWAFPDVRCEAARHLDAPQMEGAGYSCHMKTTAKVAQEWYESKHGVTLARTSAPAATPSP